ncbi:MAG: glutamate--tRNA ligase [bacterium]|nr:glutamate--tRNA ligase [bacterium]
MTNKIITRFAPSPTGALHIGAARTALFNFVFSQQKKGSMILRIEDTDKERSKKHHEDDILKSLEWLHIEYSNLYRQSERIDIYYSYITKLIKNNYAYTAEDGIIRFKNPSKKITFHDLVRGDIEVDTTDLGDFVIARNEKDPLFHLAVVIDDHEMGVTHLIRGEDHISNTPRQILIQEAIGATRPLYAHIPLILAPNRSKLSKRHGATPISDYRKEGYLSEAIVNFIALLGWSPQQKDAHGPEIFSLQELINIFSLDGVQKGGAIFDIDKLRWVNHEHIKRLTDDRFTKQIEPFLPSEIKTMNNHSRQVFLSVLKEKINVFGDVTILHSSGELSYFFKQPKYKKEGLLPKSETNLNLIAPHIDKSIELLSSLTEDKFIANLIKEKMWLYATEKGRGLVLWPFRYALSGKEKSSDPFVIAEILGKKETLNRLTHARNLIKK